MYFTCIHMYFMCIHEKYTCYTPGNVVFATSKNSHFDSSQSSSDHIQWFKCLQVVILHGYVTIVWYHMHWSSLIIAANAVHHFSCCPLYLKAVGDWVNLDCSWHILQQQPSMWPVMTGHLLIKGPVMTSPDWSHTGKMTGWEVVCDQSGGGLWPVTY